MFIEQVFFFIYIINLFICLDLHVHTDALIHLLSTVKCFSYRNYCSLMLKKFLNILITAIFCVD